MHSRRHILILWKRMISVTDLPVSDNVFSTQSHCFDVVSDGKATDFLFLQIAEDWLPRSGTSRQRTSPLEQHQNLISCIDTTS